MPTVPVSSPALNTRIRFRTALVASADVGFRQRLSESLSGLRWQVREAEGGADAWTQTLSVPPEAVIVDSWLPDLDLGEFVKEFRGNFPRVDLIAVGGDQEFNGARSPHRHELLYALQNCQDSDMPPWKAGPQMPESKTMNYIPAHSDCPGELVPVVDCTQAVTSESSNSGPAIPDPIADSTKVPAQNAAGKAIDSHERIPELIGNAPGMLDVSRRIRLVAPRITPVLIEGPTGSGKELVAEAVHRLSPRSKKPFVAINCAAIPEALLEAELFGHTRGAFTGAVRERVGRIEAADGGTLFLDEIGELPLALQSKLLRFVECGELQRVGANQRVKVDVRILAATHQPLAKMAQLGAFRSDLYYRLAVFLIRLPALVEHREDLPILIEHFLMRLGRSNPIKRIDKAAMALLAAHDWPGNVRELEHVLERAAILAGDDPVLTSREIDFGVLVN